MCWRTVHSHQTWQLFLAVVTNMVTHCEGGHPILQLQFSQVSNCGCVGHSGEKAHPIWSHKLSLEIAGSPFHRLDSQILEDVGCWLPKFPDFHLNICLHWDCLWWWQAFLVFNLRYVPPHTIPLVPPKSSLALAERIWKVFHWHQACIELCTA